MKSSVSVLFILLISCLALRMSAAGQYPSQSQTNKPTQATIKQSNGVISFKIIDAPDNSFGYDIFLNGKLYIHQVSVPGVPGVKGFNSKTSAQKVAQLVMSKIKSGEVPPTISAEELKNLKVI